jgi:hypothetical protein
MPDEPQPFGPDSPRCPHCGSKESGIFREVRVCFVPPFLEERLNRLGELSVKLIGDNYSPISHDVRCRACKWIRTDVVWPEEK